MAISVATIKATFMPTQSLCMKSDLNRQKFHELYTAGVTYDEIAEALGISKRTASNWAREMALTRRRGGPCRDRWVPNKKQKIG